MILSKETEKKTALVVGASGVAGGALVQHLARLDWNVLALSRRSDTSTRANITFISADLLDKDKLSKALSKHAVSHVFYAAHKKEGLLNANKPINVKRLRQQIIFAGKFLPLLQLIPGAMHAYYRFAAKEAGAFDKEKTNLLMFRNLIEALQETGAPLKHVCLITGAKYYGMHLGYELYPNYTLPFKEDETPRVPGPNWYYDVEDYLSEGSKDYSWSVFRPSFIIGAAIDSPFNFGTALAVYFVIQKLKNEPVVFWGDQEASQCTWDISPAQQIARMMVWSGEEKKAHGQAFNCATGKSFSWNELWPQLANKLNIPFDMNTSGFSMKRYVDDNQELWTKVVTKYNLRDNALNDLISWEFIDKSMAINWDVAFDMSKATQMGFHEYDSTENVFTQLFEQLADLRIIPKWDAL